jgi:biotin carboxylase
MSTELERGYRHANAACPTEPFVLVEQFIEGPEVSVETLSFRGGHHVIAITDKRTSGDPHWVETGHVEPSRLTPIQQETISSCAKAALQALGVSNAAGHVEIKLGPGGPVLIELGARLGGDYITTELVHRSTGVDMVEAVIRIALGQKPDIRSTKNHGAAIRYLCSGVGRIKRFEGWEVARTMEGVKRAELSMHPGDQVSGGVSSVDRPGFIICEGASPAEAEARAEAAVAAVTIHLE